MHYVDHLKGISKVSKWWFLLYLVVVSSALFLFFFNRAYDDPFITYRYADNLQHGYGFVYNPGEKVLSTTTPLLAMVLALFGSLWPDYHHLAVLLGAISLAVGAIGLWDLAITWKLKYVGWVSLVLYPTFPLLVATLGSETPIYLALCIWAFAGYARGRYQLAALIAGLATLTRPDGILVAVLMGVDFILRRRYPIPWRAIAIFLGILTAWVLFAWFYFGSPMPVTLIAKHNQGSLAISERFAAGFFTILRGYRSWLYYLEAIVALLGVIFAFVKQRAWLIILGWTAFYFLSYAVLGVSRYFWYYAPLVPGFLVAVGLGTSALASWSSLLSESPRHISIKSADLVSVILLTIFFFAQTGSLWHLHNQPDNRFAIYQAVGEWINENSGANERVGALEVGIIGYYAKRPMVDFAGLIQPEIARQLPGGKDYEEAAVWAADTYRPEYLALQDGLFPKLESGYVMENCALIQVFQGAMYGYPADLDIYACHR